MEGPLARGQRKLYSGQAGRVRRALEPGSLNLSGRQPLLPRAFWPVLGPSPAWACCPTTGWARVPPITIKEARAAPLACLKVTARLL